MADTKPTISPITTTSPSPQQHLLIIICCHAIYLGPSPSEENWLIQPYQAGETPTFMSHIREGVRLLVSARQYGREATLVFSGGRTRKETPISEAESYLSLLLSQPSLWPIAPDEIAPYRKYIFAESSALDSYQNILFPLKLYRSTFPSSSSSSSSPLEAKVISHAFKQPRFEDLHFPVISKQFPETQLQFIGIDPPYMASSVPADVERTKSVLEGEKRAGYEPWVEDPMGEGEMLGGKRRGRDVWWRAGEEVKWVRGDEVVRGEVGKVEAKNAAPE